MHIFLVTRYLFLALFTALNVIIATVAAWNTQYAAAGVATQIDSYLIAVAILGILLVFPVIFVELVRKGAFINRVWFEVAWTAVFWLLHLSGAAASSAVQPHNACSAFALKAWANACVSTNVLLAFTWVSTVTLLAYLITLLVVAVLHMADVPRIWSSSVRDVDWFSAAPQRLPSPVLPVFQQHSVGKVPLYTVSVQPATLVTVPSAPSEKLVVAAASQPSPPRTTAPLHSTHDTPPLYPHFVQPLVQNKPTVFVGPEPLPAGQWPRPDPRRQPSASASAPSSPVSTTSSTSSRTAATSPSQANPRTGLKPLMLQQSAGPVRLTQSAGARTKPRPPPLNLSGISSFNSNKAQRQDRAPRR